MAEIILKKPNKNYLFLKESLLDKKLTIGNIFLRVLNFLNRQYKFVFALTYHYNVNSTMAE